MRLTPCLAPILLAVAPTPVLAQIPDTVARIEVLSGWRGADGWHRGGLSVELAPGWKTYWRAAGAGGIPPVFAWDGSANLVALNVHFPVPQVFDLNDMRSFGYETRVVFPFMARPGDGAGDIVLNGRIELGVCLDVCIPVTLEIDDVLPAEGEADRPALTAAFADRPRTADEAGMSGMTCDVEPIADGLRLTATFEQPQGFDMAAAVLELDDPSIWVSDVSLADTGPGMQAVGDLVPPTAQPFFLARDTVRLTLLGDGVAVELKGCD